MTEFNKRLMLQVIWETTRKYMYTNFLIEKQLTALSEVVKQNI